MQQLQNTVAYQRMSNSRTVLDDNEYTTRFGRLDGAINNLAFNIRKDWGNVPAWLRPVVNEDAHMAGTREMTAIGRACLTRWLVDELFDKYLHPAIDHDLSRQLKFIERNIRRTAATVTEEDYDNQLSKLSVWRRATLDGLSDTMQRIGPECRHELTTRLISKLTNDLANNLKTPPPPGLEDGVAMVVELAVGIAANLPLESREVSIEYFLPFQPLIESHMKVETTLPPLTKPAVDLWHTASPPAPTLDPAPVDQAPGPSNSGERATPDEEPAQPRPPKKSMFGAFMGKAKAAAPSSSSTSGNGATLTPVPTTDSIAGARDEQSQQQQQQSSASQALLQPQLSGTTADGSGGAGVGSAAGSGAGPATAAAAAAGAGIGAGAGAGAVLSKEAAATNAPMPVVPGPDTRIRFASFLSVTARGKGVTNVLVKAPVYTMQGSTGTT